MLTFELLTVPTARQRKAMDLRDHHARTQEPQATRKSGVPGVLSNVVSE
jgi:hypothetical protein